MVVRCFACGYRGNQRPRRSFHRFPVDPDLQQQWLDALDKVGPLNGRTSLCNIHFEESNFRYGLVRGHRILKAGSVPIPQPKKPRMTVSISNTGNLEIEGHLGQVGDETEEITIKMEDDTCDIQNEPSEIQDEVCDKQDEDEKSDQATSSSDPTDSPSPKRQKLPEPIHTSSIKVDIKEEVYSDSTDSAASDEGSWEDKVSATLKHIKKEIRRLKGDEFDAFGKLVASELRKLPSGSSTKLKPAILNLIRQVAIMDNAEVQELE